MPVVILARVLPAVLRSPRPLLLVVAACVPFALSACTSQSSSGKTFTGAKKQADDVVTKLSDYADADSRNAEAICTKLFTAKLQGEFDKVGGGEGCKAAVLRAIRNADYTRLAVDSITLNGADATATRADVNIKVQSDGPTRGIVLVRDDAKSPWKIDSFVAKVTRSTKPTTPSSTTPSPTTSAQTTPKP